MKHRITFVVVCLLLLAGVAAGAEAGSKQSPIPLAGHLRLEKTVFAQGEKFKVMFTVPDDWPRDAWVGIVPSDVPHGSEAENDKHDLTYQRLGNRTTGTLTFMAPKKPGQYDIRIHDTDNNGREMDSLTIQVN